MPSIFSVSCTMSRSLSSVPHLLWGCLPIRTVSTTLSGKVSLAEYGT